MTLGIQSQNRLNADKRSAPSCTYQSCLRTVTKTGRCNYHQFEEYLQLQPDALDKIEIGLSRWLSPSADGCWLYTYEPMLDKYGYGRFLPDGRWAQVHKWLFMHLVGPVPDGYHIHHWCTVRNCCRPGHLKPMTPDDHIEQTRMDVAFRALFPDEKIVGPNLSHTVRERRFGQVWALPYQDVLPQNHLHAEPSKALLPSAAFQMK